MTKGVETPVPIQMRVLAYIARGDKYADIITNIQEEFSYRMIPSVIEVIKKRNKEALQQLKQAIIKREIVTAKNLRDQSQRLIGRRLDKAEKDAQLLDDIESDYRRGLINYKVYRDKLKSFNMPSLSELTNLSHEMHSQAKEGSGEVPATPESYKERMAEIASLLQSGDDIELHRIVFGVKREETTHVKPDEIQGKSGPDISTE